MVLKLSPLVSVGLSSRKLARCSILVLRLGVGLLNGMSRTKVRTVALCLVLATLAPRKNVGCLSVMGCVVRVMVSMSIPVGIPLSVLCGSC